MAGSENAQSEEQHIAGAGFLESFVQRYPVAILETLLRDRTTGRNIIWADNEYEALGEGYMGDDEITIDKITGLNSGVIKPRIAKEQEKQSQRTKSRAEVFTPSWLCNQMNNDLDEQWFGKRDIFNTENEKGWEARLEAVEFPSGSKRGWHAYIKAKMLEITCGEAPFICSRYDTVSGQQLPVQQRIGFLDRKLRVVSEKTKTRKEWTKQALIALKSCYGYEYQGDNLLIARINVFETFMEHLRARWNATPTVEDFEQVALVVSWNLWQMNGLTCAVPTNKQGAVVQSSLFEYEEPKPESLQISMFDFIDDICEEELVKEEEQEDIVPLCVIYNWEEDKAFEFAALKGKTDMAKKFYAVIGNPPYQEEVEGNGRSAPIYNYFMDDSYKISDKTELITPARFLFRAGQTSKKWNEKMLKDVHFKVQYFQQNSSEVFAGTDIKGGVAITYRDSSKTFEPIIQFTSYPELGSILRKVLAKNPKYFIDSIVSSRGMYRFTELFFEEHPEIVQKKGTGNMITSKAFDSLGEIFSKSKINEDYICLYGREESERTAKYIPKKYIIDNEYLQTFNVFVPEGNGSGAIGEVLSTPLIGQPLIGHTDTFLSIGKFSSENESLACLKYIKSKFARCMLGILKVTQHNPASTWKYVPLQDFTSNSDIDWSKSIHEIDLQLYEKYGLDKDEIEFIESHVKEMS